MEDRSGAPLTPAQVDDIIDAAQDMGFRCRLIAEVVPYTGLTSTELCHLRKDWLRYTHPDEDRFNIKIPLASPCAGTLRTTPSGREIETLEEPCYLCRNDGEWTPTGRCRHRAIPVPEPAKEALALCFERYEMDSLPFTVSSNFYQWMDDLASRADLSRTFGFKALRRTYGAILIRKGFSSEQVATYLGLHRRSKTRPLYEAIGEPIDWDTLPARGVSDEELIEALQRLTVRLGRRPKMKDIDQRFEYSYKPLYTRFGGLHDALRAADIHIPDKDPQAISTDDLVVGLQQLADDLDRPPTSVEMQNHGEYSCSPYWRQFGGWDEALEAAGLNSEAPRGDQIPEISRQELLEDLHRLVDELDRPPKKRDVQRKGKYSASTYIRRFDGIKNAREEANIDDPSNTIYSDEELLADLRRVAKELGHTPSTYDIRELSEYCSPTFKNRFGGLDEACAAAGLSTD